jgi:hypothetical protein
MDASRATMEGLPHNRLPEIAKEYYWLAEVKYQGCN